MHIFLKESLRICVCPIADFLDMEVKELEFIRTSILIDLHKSFFVISTQFRKRYHTVQRFYGPHENAGWAITGHLRTKSDDFGHVEGFSAPDMLNWIKRRICAKVGSMSCPSVQLFDAVSCVGAMPNSTHASIRFTVACPSFPC